MYFLFGKIVMTFYTDVMSDACKKLSLMFYK